MGAYENWLFEFRDNGHLLRTVHDNTSSGGWDRDGFKPGDSGGTCYYSNGFGGVIATGVVKGEYWYPWTHYYFCPQLSGVRAYTPAWVG